MKYEIRPHHCFKNWVLVFRDGVSLRAFTNKTEAEQFIARHKHLADFEKRKVKL